MPCGSQVSNPFPCLKRETQPPTAGLSSELQTLPRSIPHADLTNIFCVLSKASNATKKQALISERNQTAHLHSNSGSRSQTNL